MRQERCIFVGTPLPPQVAKYKGSWLRPAEFIPIGLSGMGEVSWTINSYKDGGRALYVYDDGRKAQTVDSPSAPQAIMCWRYRGGKAIYVNQEVEIDD